RPNPADGRGGSRNPRRARPRAAVLRRIESCAAASHHHQMNVLATRRRVFQGMAAAIAMQWPGVASPAPTSTLEGLLRRRGMIRRFRAEAVGDGAIDRLISAATRAPSAGHTEPWAFVVVRDDHTRARLGRAAYGQMFVADAPVVVVACADAS